MGMKNAAYKWTRRSALTVLSGLAMLALTPAPAYAVCTNPAGAGGDIIYNGDDSLMSYCDDTNWIGLRGTAPTPNVVQISAFTPSGTSVLLPNVQPGNALVVLFNNHSSGSRTWQTSDDVEGLWTNEIQQDGPNTRDIYVAYFLNHTGGNVTITTETVAFSNFGNYRVFEISDVGAFDTNIGWLTYVNDSNVDPVIPFSPAINTPNKSITLMTLQNSADAGNHTFAESGWIEAHDNQNSVMGYRIDAVGATGITGEVDVQTPRGAAVIGLTLKAASSLKTGLVGHWKLDETVGTTAIDSSSGGNNGTMNGGLDAGNDSVPGKINTSLDFDGTNDEIDTGDIDAMDGVSQLTISAWMRRTALNDHVTVQKGNGSDRTGINYWDNGRLYFNIGNAGSTWGFITQNDTDWHHVALVFDGTQTGNSSRLKGYLDGIELTLSYSGTIPALTATQANSFLIGHNQANNDRSQGQIDDVRIYNRILSASEISELSAACEEGSMIYNKDHHVPQYCAGGDTWTAMGPVRDGIDSDLIAHWKLDETSGSSIADFSGNGNTGTWTDGSGNSLVEETVDAKISTGIDMDGTDDYINTGSDTSLDNLSAISVSAWIKPDADCNLCAIVGKYDIFDGFSYNGNTGWVFQYWDNGAGLEKRLRFSAGFNGTGPVYNGTSSAVLTLNEWQHVAATWTGSTSGSDIKLYVNGIETTYATPVDGTLPRDDDSANDLFIGRATGTDPFNGSIDDVRIYNRTISSAEVMALYELGLDNDPSLVGHWKMDDLSGTTAEDATTNNNDGALMNFDTPAEWTSSGKVDGSLNFDGVDNVIHITDPGANSVLDQDSGESITIAAWVKNDALGGWDNVVTKLGGPNYSLQTLGSGVNIGYNSGGWHDFTAGNTLTAGQWHHIAASRTNNGNPADVTIYIDGQPIAGGSWIVGDGTAIANASDSVLVIGAESSDGTANSFNGNIDDVRIYNRILSDTEVDALYKLGIGHCTNPVGKEGDLIYNDDVGVDALQYCDGANWQASGKSP